MIDVEHVEDACARFRAAIVADEHLPAPMHDFPTGACGDTSEMLGQYLQDSGLSIWAFVMGFRPRDGWTHAWLETGDVIADITADQFDDVTSPVIVTRDRQWHDREFPRASGRRPASMAHFYGAFLEVQMHATYERLRASADKLR